jgi:hypothetical protein
MLKDASLYLFVSPLQLRRNLSTWTLFSKVQMWILNCSSVSLRF